jgi:hypothetical protein
LLYTLSVYLQLCLFLPFHFRFQINTYTHYTLTHKTTVSYTLSA